MLVGIPSIENASGFIQNVISRTMSYRYMLLSTWERFAYGLQLPANGQPVQRLVYWAQLALQQQ